MSLLNTLIPWSEQVFVLTTAAALAALALTQAKARLRMWQGLLLVLLLLPAIEPWRTPPVEADSVEASSGVTAAAAVAAPLKMHWRTEDWMWVIAAGAVLRLMLVAAGFLRLSRYRKQATPLA